MFDSTVPHWLTFMKLILMEVRKWTVCRNQWLQYVAEIPVRCCPKQPTGITFIHHFLWQWRNPTSANCFANYAGNLCDNCSAVVEGGGGASPPPKILEGECRPPPKKSCYWTWSGKNIWRGALVGRQKRKEGKRGLEGTKVKGMRGVEAAGQQRFFCLPIQNWTSAPPKKIYDYTTGQLQAVSVPLAN